MPTVGVVMNVSLTVTFFSKKKKVHLESWTAVPAVVLI